jgi:hypothetical protein
VQETLEHDLLRRIEEEGELGGDDRALEGVGLVKFAREACVKSAYNPPMVCTVNIPSIKNMVFFSVSIAFFIAFSNSWIVTSIGTIVPSLMYVLIISPNSLPGRSCSSRSKSPALRCLKP